MQPRNGRNTKVLKVSIPLTEDDLRVISECAGILKRGGLVAFPTETVYGLGALAEDGDAVRSIFEAKGRPQDNPLIVHVAGFDEVHRLVSEMPPVAARLAAEFWPGPLSLVMKSSGVVAKETTAGLDTLAIRMPDNAVALELIRRAGPIAAPSANSSGRPSPTRAEHVYSDIAGRIDAIIDAGPTGVGVESTVLDISTDLPTILRPGGVTYEQLSRLIPGLISHSSQHQEKPKSPGQKYMHYSPRAHVVLVKGINPVTVCWKVIEEANNLLLAGDRVGILATQENAPLCRQLFDGCIREGRVVVIDVGSRQRPEEIAANLFDALRKFDWYGVDGIVAEGIQELEIGAAIMDRLGRAASRTVVAKAENGVEHTGFSQEPSLELDPGRAHGRPYKVVFVCTGNTCRSPLAEVIIQKAAEDAGLGGSVVFESAGLGAYDGDHASEHALSVAAEQLLSLERHRARRLTYEICAAADLIITMTRGHKMELIRRFPEMHGKVHTIGEFAGEPEEQVPDPFGRQMGEYRRTADKLRHFSATILRRIKEALGAS